MTGAPANELEGIVPDEVMDERFARLMEVAQDVSTGQLAKKVGRTIEVLVDDVKPAEGRAIARSKWDAPEIDGQVIVDKAQGHQARRQSHRCESQVRTSTICSLSR